MTKPDIRNMSCREYAETMHEGWGEFRARKPDLFLYLHAGSRLRVSHEQRTEPGFGYDRTDAIDETFAEHGKCAAERDADEFARDFVQHFCDHLSIRQLDILIPALIAHRDELEARRQVAISQMRPKGEIA